MLTRQEVLENPALLDRLIREHRMFREAIEESPVLFCIYDAQDRLVAWNPSYEQNHREVFAERGEDARAGRLTYGDVVRYHLSGTFSGADLDRAVAERVAAQRLSTGKPVERHSPVLGHLRVMKYRLPSGAVAGFAVGIDDLVKAQAEREEKAAELERAYAVMRDLALHDALTGLPNRRYMDDYLRAATVADGDTVPEIAMLHLDLDRFKSINDTLGHAAGDHVLRHVADVLRGLCRPEDFAARIGGDEFTVIRKGPATLASLRDFADRLIAAISRPQDYQAQRCRVGVSIGIARLGLAGVTAADLMVHADLALYQAKEAGRSRVSVYDPEMHRRDAVQDDTADALAEAVRLGQFCPVYQPQFDASTLAVTGLEVLARWRHPTCGLLAAEAFVSAADRAGLMADIDAQLLDLAQAEISALARSGLYSGKVSLNLSESRAVDRVLPDQLAALLRTGCAVSIEVMGGMAGRADSLQDLGCAVDRLQAAGIGIEIEDLAGIGASFAGLFALRPDALKIDSQLVAPLPGSERHRQIVAALVRLGKSLGLTVIGEGAETPEHVAVLRALGCDLIQGFALAQPMPVAQLRLFLQRSADAAAGARQAV